MRLKLAAIATIGLLALSGCSNTWEVDYEAPLDNSVTKNWRISKVDVIVPESLTTSDENSLAPNYDVVWHGDLPGDRKAQIAQLMEEGIRKGSTSLRGSKRVILRVVVAQFHAVTPAAVSRAPAAVHDIRYTIQAFDARTGKALNEPVLINADLSAYVGSQAVVAAQSGQTQKVRIRNHLARVTMGWLGTGPAPRESFTSIGR